MSKYGKQLLYIPLISVFIFSGVMGVMYKIYTKEEKSYLEFVKFASNIDYNLKVLGAKYLSQFRQIEREKKLRELAERQAEELKSSLDEMQSKLRTQAPRLKSRIKELEKMIVRLNEEKRELTDSLRELEANLKRTHSRISQLDKIKEENQKLSQELEKLDSEFKKALWEKKKLYSKLERLETIKEKLDSLNKEKRELMAELNSTRLDKKRLEKEIEELRDTVDELKNKLSEAQIRLAFAEQKVKDNQVELGIRAERILDLTQKIQKLSEQKTNLLEDFKQKENLLLEKDEKIKKLEEKLTQLQEELENQKKQFSQLGEENKKLKEELRTAQINYDNISQLLNQVSEASEQMQAKLSDLNKIISDPTRVAIKSEKSIVDLGRMSIQDVDPEIALSSMIYQFRKAREEAAPSEEEDYIRKEAICHYNLGVYYLKNERIEDALKEFLKAYKLQPQDPDTLYNIGLTYRYYLYDYDKARVFLKKYLELNPSAQDAERVKNILAEIEK